MNRNVLIEYTGNCPSCGKLQVSGKPDEVDVLCCKCHAAQEGKIMYIRDAEYGDSDSVQISIETPFVTVSI